MEHADKLVDRVIFLDGFPNMQVHDPLHIGQTVKEVLDCDLAAEVSARVNGTATVSDDDPLVAETVGAQLIVRVTARAISNTIASI